MTPLVARNLQAAFQVIRIHEEAKAVGPHTICGTDK